MGKKSRRNPEKKKNKKTSNNNYVDNPASADMIFYPEEAWDGTAVPSGASVRGNVGHNAMFEVNLLVYESRIQDSWSADASIFEEFTPILLSFMDAATMQNSDENFRTKSTTIVQSEKRLNLQLSLLEHRLQMGEESFLFIPLETFYFNIPHQFIEIILGRFGMPPRLLGTVMMAYNTNVSIRTHKEGLIFGVNDRVKPPDEALLGPHPFKRGLRLQCAMTPTIATMLLFCLVKGAKISPTDVFILPHGLVFASKDPDHKFEEIINKISDITPMIYHNSEELWCTAGKHTNVKPMVFGLPWNGDVSENEPVAIMQGEESIRHVGNEQFMKEIEEKGCSWYPVFSSNPESTLTNPLA